jgi:hypothetical protein
MIKPILKLRDKLNGVDQQSKDENQINFINEAIIKAMGEWIIAEPNLTQQVINLINIIMSTKNIPKERELTMIIKTEAIIRIFKDMGTNITKEGLNTIPQRLKHPQLINIISKAPTHIIEEIAETNYNNLEDPQTKKQIIKQLKPYYILSTIK